MSSSENVSPSLTQPSPTNSDLLRELADLTQELLRRTRGTKLFRYRPYPKQREFHAAGARHRERLLMAANQVGKTLAGACEAAYPDWWEGKRWERPVKGWAGSESTELTRDGVQRMLVGPPKIEAEWGTGLIPKHSRAGALLAEALAQPGSSSAQAIEAVPATSPRIEIARVKSVDPMATNFRLSDRRVGLIEGFYLSDSRAIGGTWELPNFIEPAPDTFEARYGQW